MWVELALFCLVVALLRYYIRTPRGMPPGPFVIPYVGTKIVFSVQQARECRDKYGDIFKAEMFGLRTVFLCNYKLIKEGFSRPDITYRPDNEAMHFISDGVPAGVIMTNGKHWQNARRFLLRNLRDFGMGKTYLEEAIQKEATGLVEDFKKFSGTPAVFPKSLNVAVLNVVWQMVASKRFDLDDERVLGFVNIIRGGETNLAVLLLFLFPKLVKHLPAFVRKKWMMEDVLTAMKDEGQKMGKEIIDSHRASLDPDHPRDVVDEYLLAMDENSDIAAYFNEKDLVKIIFDLFTAGFDTVSNTLRWFILYMAKYPEVQRRIQQQIDAVVPRDTLPSYEHKPQLPLVEAMVHEVLRKSSLIALGVHHGTQTDVNLAGYLIPKNSMVIGAAIFCHEDPQYWEQPDQFRLEHFLDEEGNFVSQKEGFLPFSIGRRSCLGEALARMELYIFTSALLQNFTFSAPEGCELDLEASPKQPSMRLAKDQEILITTRNVN